MAIPQGDILRFESMASTRKSFEIIKEAKAGRKQTAFLCHSHKDARLAKSVQAFLQSTGWEVYIDWDDSTMPDRPNQETASRIQGTIKDLNWFLFLATQNSMDSRWCPWEIGYADGVKPHDSILVIPTSDYTGTHGNEYLGLYRHINSDKTGRYAVFRPDGNGVWMASLKPIV